MLVGFMRRFDPGYVELKAAFDAGDRGAPRWCTASAAASARPRGRRTSSRITSSAIHEFDVVPWLLDARSWR